jgi:hypothetical protein
VRTLLLAALLATVGCGSKAAPTPDAAGANKLPPEVEFDPATAAEKYKAAKKTQRP